MSLPRRIRHRASQKQLVREGFYCYILAFAVIFLHLHFGKHFSLLSDVEQLPANAAVREAMLWAFIGPAVWIFQGYVLQGTELWASYSGLGWQMQRCSGSFWAVQSFWLQRPLLLGAGCCRSGGLRRLLPCISASHGQRTVCSLKTCSPRHGRLVEPRSPTAVNRPLRSKLRRRFLHLRDYIPTLHPHAVARAIGRPKCRP
jgi:hypothetical protein